MGYVWGCKYDIHVILLGEGSGQRTEVRGISPAKPKIECGALGIGLVFKSLTGATVEMYRVRWMR
jgi:hypothetical protein